MTVTDIDPDATMTGVGAVPAVPAPWSRRAGALAVDVVPSTAVLATMGLVALSLPPHTPWWWTCLLIGAATILVTAVNRILLPRVGGQSLGRALLLCTQSRVADPPPAGRNPRRRTAAVLLAAAMLCAIGAAMSYRVVYQRDQAISSATAEVAANGARMVEQILSYRDEDAREHFDRARSLVTDNYAPQLSGQQRAAQNAGLLRNEYWVTNSSVLTATPGRATMLLFLQGERGTPPNQTYVTASVRATFVDTGRVGWLVDDITVVTAPQPVEAAP